MTLRKVKSFFKKSVSGLITGAAGNDPAGITTYSMSGALFGFSQLWLMVLAAPMIIAILGMCSRLGNIQKQGLTKIINANFPKWVGLLAVGVLLISNIVTIGADILAVSAAFGLLTKVPFEYWVLPVTVAIWYLMVFQSFRILRLFILMVIPFMFSYVLAAVLARPDWSEVVRSILVPQLNNIQPGYFIAAVGIMGTTITPYLLFWHTREQVEERKTKRQIAVELKNEDLVTAPGLIFSQLITLFIMIAGAAALFGTGQGIQTAADAARALEPIGGNWATALFAIGIISSGVIALPVLAGSTAYALGEALNLKHESLHDKPKRALGFYVIISFSLLAGVVMTMLNLDPIKSLYYSQVLAGILAPIIVGMVIILANRQSVVGDQGASKFENIFAGLAMMFIVGAAVLMII